jgi:hypothetical protein
MQWEQMHSSTHLLHWYDREVESLKLLTLYPWEITPVPSEKDAACGLALVWTFWRREKSLVPAGI